MSDITIEVVNVSGNPLPSYATPGSAGMDLRASLELAVTLNPMQRQLIPTGLSMAVPAGYEAQIRPRSGLAVNAGITCLNSPGTIDSDYRGEVKVLLINLSDQPFIIKNNDRIAQIVIAPVVRSSLKVVQKLEDTSRGDGGFGHTGTN